MKKGIALLLAGLLGLSMLSGCGASAGTSSKAASTAVSESTADKSSAGSSTGSASASGSGEKMTMMLNGSASDAYVAGFSKIIDDFNANNKYGVTISYEFITNSDYKTKLTTMMASDSQPDIIFTWELGYLQNFVNGKKVVSLQKYLDEDTAWKAKFQAGTLEQDTINGEVYAIPTSTTMAIMYYNKAIFDKYSLKVPTTYEEYRNVCDTLLKNGVTPVALASTADDAWLVSQYIQQLSDGIGGSDLFNGLKDGTKKWNDDAMIKAASLFKEEVNAGYFEKGFTGVSGDEAKAVFQNGQAAMYFNGAWEIPNLDNTKSCAEADNISAFAMPAVESSNANISVGSVDTSYAITTNCKNVDAAVAFLKSWTSDENAETLLYDYGRIPATTFDVDQSKLSPLTAQALDVLHAQTALTPWFDRVNTDYGNEFNNSSVAIANGDDVKTTFDNLEQYVESNK